LKGGLEVFVSLLLALAISADTVVANLALGRRRTRRSSELVPGAWLGRRFERLAVDLKFEIASRHQSLTLAFDLSGGWPG
jgi:hypothetical protein